MKCSAYWIIHYVRQENERIVGDVQEINGVRDDFHITKSESLRYGPIEVLKSRPALYTVQVFSICAAMGFALVSRLITIFPIRMPGNSTKRYKLQEMR